MNKEQLLNIIMAELKNICIENGIESTTIDSETILFGGTSIIDSLALVGLIIKVEEYIFDQTGREIQVVDENAIITDSETPFKNATTLAELVMTKIYEE